MSRLLEHDGLMLLAAAGMAVAPFEVAPTPERASAAAGRLGGGVVVKALVPSAGRGKAGGVIPADTPRSAAEAARALLGLRIGHFPVERVLVQARLDVHREYFASITFDSRSRRPIVLFSPEGGVDVEDLVRDRPASLIARTLEPVEELPAALAVEIATEAGLDRARAIAVAEALARLYRVFCANDAFLVEVNPLVADAVGALVAPSAVVVLDDQAAFRHPEWSALDRRETTGWRPLTPLERRMREIDASDAGSAIRFNEIAEGRIACMLTGGGSGLVSLDHFLRLGEPPATTFDITPGHVEEKMYLATLAILSRPGIAGLIAGGNITNFIPIDVKVRGVVRALTELGIDGHRFPIVFRYAGPGVEAARELAARVPGIEFYDETTSLERAVERIVERVREAAA